MDRDPSGFPLLPVLSGRAIQVVVRKSLGPHHAATSIPKRTILLDSGLLAAEGEFERILIHEVFHFVWVRLGNARRLEWEGQLAREFSKGVRGELGWSAESRKENITPQDVAGRTLRWRQYCCESFCDTAAWVYSGVVKHDEFTLRQAAVKGRKAWFARRFEDGEPVRI